MQWSIFFFIIGGALACWFGFRMVRGNPAAFSRVSISRSFFTLGILALVLIGVIVICVKIVQV